MTKYQDKKLDMLDKSGEIKQKQFEILEDRVETQYSELQKRKDELEKNSKVNVGKSDADKIAEIARQNTEYLMLARTSGVFLFNDFSGSVPFFAKNLLLVAGKTGDGKSTLSSNLVFRTITQKTCKKILILTNEENVSDVYNRVTCLIKGWSYANHESFTDEQIKTFGEYIQILSTRMVVIDDTYMGVPGQTTSYEGIKSIFDNLIKNNIKYDAIILDYFQNITTSKENPSMGPYEVQDKMSGYLDSFKNLYSAPIVVLAQLKSTDDKIPFKERLEGRKSIMNRCTCAMEVRADKENHSTVFTIHKSRFPASQGKSIRVGYQKGKYVEYTMEFEANSQVQKIQNNQKNLLSRILKDKDKNEN